MAAPISVVIPTLNASGGLGPCLEALVPGVIDGLVAELVISDGGSTDGIEDVAEAAGAELILGPAGRGGQLRRGAEAARGQWLLFVHADTVLSAEWTGAVRRHMEETPQAAGWFRLEFDQGGSAAALTAGWANWRSRLFGLPYGDQGLLVRRDVYRAAGGFPDQPLMEDVALVRRLKTQEIAATARTSAERYRRDGWLRRGWRNLTTLLLWYAGASPGWLARRYAR